tara:strand:+ start:275 stop:793 length:519 start_codon:yes stop_codon:yes gene_type:complete
MSELVSEFGQNYPELNEALHDFKTDLTSASVDLFDAKLATTNQTYEIVNNGDSFTIKGSEFLLNTIDFAVFESLNDAVDTFVDDIMVTDPDGEDEDRDPIDVHEMGEIEQWVSGIKLEFAENRIEKERVHSSPNPKQEIQKIAVRIIRAQRQRKALRLEKERLGAYFSWSMK